MIRISALILAASLATALTTVTARADDTPALLSTEGTTLPAMQVTWSDADLSQIVDTGGDQVLATYIVARVHSTSQAMQRTNLGYWVPWDGSTDSLVDNQMPQANDQITYKILDQSLDGLTAPLTVTLIYRTPDGMKLGQFYVEAKP